MHHWDSMMVVGETTRSLFPPDLFIQPADQPPVVTEDLSAPMIAGSGIRRVGGNAAMVAGISAGARMTNEGRT